MDRQGEELELDVVETFDAWQLDPSRLDRADPVVVLGAESVSA